MKRDTRQAILNTAQALFREKGYNAVSVGEIAAALGISKGNLTYYFKRKEEIVEALLEGTASTFPTEPPGRWRIWTPACRTWSGQGRTTPSTSAATPSWASCRRRSGPGSGGVPQVQRPAPPGPGQPDGRGPAPAGGLPRGAGPGGGHRLPHRRLLAALL